MAGLVGVFAGGPTTVANANYDANPTYDVGSIVPRKWAVMLDTSDPTASYRCSFDGTNDHVILTYGAPGVVIANPARKMWTRKVAGAGTIIVHVDGGQ